MLSEQEEKEFELRCRKFGLNCIILVHVRTEEVRNYFPTFRAHKTIHRLGNKLLCLHLSKRQWLFFFFVL